MFGQPRKTSLKIQTNIPEIYMKLPGLNYNSEIIFSNMVPLRSLKKIVEKFKKNGVDVDLVSVGDRYAIIKKSPVKFDTYLIKSTWRL